MAGARRPPQGSGRDAVPLRIALIYLVVSLIWIWLSDLVMVWSGSQALAAFWKGAMKGSLFVLASAVLLYVVVRRECNLLARSDALLRAVADETTDAVFVKDREGKYLLFNEAAARFVGKTVEQVLGNDDTALFDPSSARLVQERDREVMARGEPITREEELTAAGVTRTYLATKAPYRDADGQVIGLIGISRDITERKRLEERLHQVQRMEAVGRLAGGIAHDFNNLLTVVNGYGDSLLEELPPEAPGRQAATAIRNAGERAARLTRQLLAFGRRSILKPRILDLNELVRESAIMLRRLIGEDIALEVKTDPSLDPVRADQGQLEQVIMNLVLNARDAMPTGGRLTIETVRVVQERADPSQQPPLEPGAYASLIVSDSGHGMTEDVRAKIFEPFFTTKAVGSGTGLGLSVVIGVVEQCGGHVGVESRVGEGTVFRLLFPACPDATPARLDPGANVPAAHNETVLVVEDEEDVRLLVQRILMAQGYQVLAADRGAAAIRMAAEHPGTIHLLLTDVVMPGMGGRALAEAVRGSRPEIKVLYLSGYTDDAVIRHGIVEGRDAFLQKPVPPRELVRKVREMLDNVS